MALAGQLFNDALLRLIIDDIFLRRDFADSTYLSVLQIDKHINDIYFMLGMEMGVSYEDALIAFRHIDTWKEGVSKFALLNTFKYLNGDPSACVTKIVQRTDLKKMGLQTTQNPGPNSKPINRVSPLTSRR
jgi:hypothetical protein